MSVVDFVFQASLWAGACVMALGAILILVIVAFFLVETFGDLRRRWEEYR